MPWDDKVVVAMNYKEYQAERWRRFRIHVYLVFFMILIMLYFFIDTGIKSGRL